MAVQGLELAARPLLVQVLGKVVQFHSQDRQRRLGPELFQLALLVVFDAVVDMADLFPIQQDGREEIVMAVVCRSP
jgi:hypothetical protein